MKEFENGFNPTNVKMAHNAISAKLRELEAELGIKLQTGTLRYDGQQFTVKITATATATASSAPKPMIENPESLIGKTYKQTRGSARYTVKSFAGGKFTVRTNRGKGYLITPAQIADMIEC